MLALLTALLLSLPLSALAQDARDQSREEQRRLQQQLEQLAAEHARNQSAREREEKQLSDLLMRQSAARRELNALKNQVTESETALKAVEAQVAANEERTQDVLEKLRDLAALHLRAKSSRSSTGPDTAAVDNKMATARNRAWAQYIGRQRAALLTELDAQNRQHRRLLANRQAARDALQLRMDAQNEQLRKLDRIATEHRNTVQALQAQERRDKQREQKLQKRLAELDDYLASLTRRKISAQAGLSALKGRLDWPVRGKVLRRFGSSKGIARSSRGTLVALKPGTEVPVVHDGTVAWVGWMPKLGLALVVDHGKDFYSLYAHAETLFFGVGDKVGAGTPILLSGQTGSPPQPALYFELRKGRKSLNPKRWFRNPP